MSLVHYEPHPELSPCIGCDESIAAGDLVKHGRHNFTSTFFWHPYHDWCLRPSPPVAAAHDACAECGESLDAGAVERALAWAWTLDRRLRRHYRIATARDQPWREDASGMIPRPRGIRLVGVAAGVVWSIATHFELAHDACAADPFVTALRAAPGDDALRAVYGDWLEQRGDLKRATVVRLAIRRNAATGDLREHLWRDLRERRRGLLGSWCRDVCASISELPHVAVE